MLLALALLTPWEMPDPPAVYSGRAGQVEVRVPRLEADLSVDGKLAEAVWGESAVLTGFSQFSPTDGIPAADTTQVLVWYSPTAIHFGVRAFEAHGPVHATLADRDKISADDYIQILLSTFNDSRQALVFSVNPLGVQSDGALVETGSTSGNGFNSAVVKREQADLSPDYVFESKGRVTEYGYEIEIRIPFKSIRFQPRKEQIWGINVVRLVQHSGREDSWTPAKRASASFLRQSGKLVGLTDLRRGVVLDFTPSLTSRTTGADGAAGWSYSGGSPELGGTLRWGITNNLTLNGTANPDFSQIESDAQQFVFDPRNELFFQEKRPFFLEAIEQFSTPSNLIYTRRIVQPVVAAKLTGKAFGTDLAVLSAVDDPALSPSADDHPLYNLLRIQRDVGSQSRVGVVYTDKVVGRDYNRVAGVDTRLVMGEIYSAQLQVAGSRTRVGGVTETGPLWSSRLARNGRTFGARYTFTGVANDFRAASGFIQRAGIVHANLDHSITLYGKQGGWLESFTGDVALDGTWEYQKFVNGEGIQDKKLHFNTNTRFGGGWQFGASVLTESFGYPGGSLHRLCARGARRGRRPGHDSLHRPTHHPESGLRALTRHAGVLPFLGEHFLSLGSRRKLLRMGQCRHHLARSGPRLAAHRPAAGEWRVPPPVCGPSQRRQHGEHLEKSADQDRISALPADLSPAGGGVHHRTARLPAGRVSNQRPHSGARSSNQPVHAHPALWPPRVPR